MLEINVQSFKKRHEDWKDTTAVKVLVLHPSYPDSKQYVHLLPALPGLTPELRAKKSPVSTAALVGPQNQN